MTKTERLLTDGRRHQENGEIAQARDCYNSVLTREPDNMDALFFLGALCAQNGENEHGMKLLERVIATRTEWPEALNNLAIVYQQAGRFEDAQRLYERAIDLRQDFVAALSNLSICQRETGHMVESIATIDRTLELVPDCHDALITKSVLLKDLGRFPEAVETLRAALETCPADAEKMTTVGDAFVQCDQVEEGIAVYDRVIAAHPDFAKVYNNKAVAIEKTVNLGNRTEVLGQMIDYLAICLEKDPDYLEGSINYAAALQRMQRRPEAAVVYAKIIDRIQDNVGALSNYGSWLQQEGRFDEAVEHFQRALAIDPDKAEAYQNWAACLQLQGRFDEALIKYDEAIKRKPTLVDAHTSRGLLLLTQGRFEEGWAEYEWRKKTDQFSGRILDRSEWDGGPLNGQRILLHAEQGQGDTFQFMRYASIIKDLGGYVIAECHDGMKSLMETCPGVDEISERHEVVSGSREIVYDVHANMMSLPRIMRTTLETIPSQVPYLSAPASFRPRWEARIRALTPLRTHLKVGFAWAGNPDHRNDIHRSTTLDFFATLASVPGVAFFSLQMGEAAKQTATPPEGFRVIDLAPEIKSFSDTAAIIENLDLVVSVDTSIVHLAGAMGAPVWTLLPVSPDFRWMLGREDSPWYPTMRLMRQDRTFHWEGLFPQIAEALEEYASDPVAWHMREAERKFGLGDRNRAKVQLLAIAKRYPTDIRLINLLGKLLWVDGDTEHAVRAFLAAMQLDPFDRATILNCGDVMAALGQTADARLLYQGYLNRRPNDAEFQLALDVLEPNGRVVARAA